MSYAPNKIHGINLLNKKQCTFIPFSYSLYMYDNHVDKFIEILLNAQVHKIHVADEVNGRKFAFLVCIASPEGKY